MASTSGSDDLRVLFDRVLTADVEHADGAEVTELVGVVQRIRSTVDAFELRCLTRNRTLRPEPTERGGRDRDTNLLRGHGHCSGRDARAAAGRADLCERIPELGAALGNGSPSSGHLDAVGRATAGTSDEMKAKLSQHGEELADAASTQSPEELERTCRDLVRSLSDDDGTAALEQQRAQRRCTRSIDRDSGMSRTTLLLDPITGDTVSTVIDAAVGAARAQRQDDDGRTWDQFVADVVVDLLCGRTRVDGTGVPEISVLVDLQTLTDGAHDATVCETSAGTDVPVATLRRLLCDCAILPITLNGAGIPVDVGRECRTATRAQRRALRAMYRTCAWHRCTTTFDQCRIHHIVYWTNHGGSDLANLLPLCEHHHHLVHEGGWTLTMSGDRLVTILAADGRVHYHGDTRNGRPRAGADAPWRCRPPRDAPNPVAAELAHAIEAWATTRARPPDAVGTD